MRVAIVGAGTMGSGVAQVCAMSGHEVAVVDLVAEQLDRARDEVASSLRRFEAKDKLGEAASIVLGRIELHGDLPAAVREADVVIESVIERIEVKQAVFRDVAAHARSGALLGTNTSHLSITSIAAAVPDRAERLVGLHFFNPPVLMRLVEIIPGLTTGDAAVQEALTFAGGLGKETVLCRKDSPGFLTSRISALVRLECLRMLEEGVADAAEIDRALCLGLNFPTGPLELGDRVGYDTLLLVSESLERLLGERFRPPVILRNMVAAGRLGRKTGLGIYPYDNLGEVVDA